MNIHTNQPMIGRLFFLENQLLDGYEGGDTLTHQGSNIGFEVLMSL